MHGTCNESTSEGALRPVSDRQTLRSSPSQSLSQLRRQMDTTPVRAVVSSTKGYCSHTQRAHCCFGRTTLQREPTLRPEPGVTALLVRVRSRPHCGVSAWPVLTCGTKLGCTWSSCQFEWVNRLSKALEARMRRGSSVNVCSSRAFATRTRCSESD